MRDNDHISIHVCGRRQVYGQGITVAAMEAEALHKLLQVPALLSPPEYYRPLHRARRVKRKEQK